MPGPIGLPFGRQFDFAMFIVQHGPSCRLPLFYQIRNADDNLGCTTTEHTWEESYTQRLNQTITYCGYGGVTGVFYLYHFLYRFGILGG
jgi:hypothetical protein